MLQRIVLIISALFFCLPAVLTQTRIQVISSSDRAPIEHVAVFNTSQDRAAITDSLGMVDLTPYRSGDTIVFQHPSYITEYRMLHQLKGRPTIQLHRKRILIDEYVISATKSRESKLIIPNMVDVLEQNELRETTGLTAADILQSTGNILVQKSQGGGGSPILRGFEANKILLVVDGVRLNNAIYRSGHLQNSITIDPAILERTEVIFGPSSIIYGSDALGGVIHYYTKDPPLSEEEFTHLDVHAYTQYASALRGKTGHLDVGIGGSKVGSLTSITYKDLGDVRTGARRSPYLGDWGKVMHVVDQVDGIDSTMVNEDPLVQLNSGYRQLDLLQKLKYAPSRYVDWILNMQYSTSSDVDRLDKLNDYQGENLKYAEYYYGPQNRALVSLKNVLKKDNTFFTNMTTLAAFQWIEETRHSRKFRNPERLSQEEEVLVASLNLDLLKIWGANHKFNYGLEYNQNQVVSEAFYQHLDSGDLRPAQTRYPEGGSQTWSASAYASYKWIMDPKMVLNGGVRYNQASLSSQFSNPLLPYESIQMTHGAFTGSLGVVLTPSSSWQINAILATGYRNPNVDDYGKVRAKDGFVTVPNNQLQPEYSYNAEVGISRVVEGYIKVELVGYYTYLTNAIVRAPYQLDGLDSLMYDGDSYRVTANHNAGEAYIYGSTMGITANLNKNITLNGTLNYTQGHNISDDAPLGHIPPIFGRTSLTYRKSRFYVNTYVVYQGWKHLEDFSPYGEDNQEEAMAYGYPSWWTANIKAGFQVGQYLDFMLAVENIFDQFYRPYASGISAPGRNFLLTARFTL